MKQYLFILITIFSSFLLASCVDNRNPYIGQDLSRESWQQAVDTNPQMWTKNADHWFFTGDPNANELANHHAPNSSAMSMMTVRVSDDVSNIKVNGAFQVQLFGTDEHNSVYVYGPNLGVRSLAVEEHQHTLYLRQTQSIPPEVMQHVIIRIGIRELSKLTQQGCGRIEAIAMRSHQLTILTTQDATGDIYFAGQVNLAHVKQFGIGSINVIGAQSPNLSIFSAGIGAVNICGKIGIQSIVHYGRGDINIIGANSNALTIFAEGVGKIGIHGVVNLQTVHAKDNVQIYAYPIRSNDLHVNVFNRARVGLAGYAQNLYVNAFQYAIFYGRSLCAQNAFVRAHDASHVNVTANNKIFASAERNSSIYFFGPSTLLSSFSSGNGIVIPMNGSWCNYYSEYRPYSYTYSHGGESVAYQTSGRRNYKGE